MQSNNFSVKYSNTLIISIEMYAIHCLNFKDINHKIYMYFRKYLKTKLNSFNEYVNILKCIKSRTMVLIFVTINKQEKNLSILLFCY